MQNKRYASEEYNTRFSESMQKDACTLVEESMQNYTGKPCEKFISGSTTQGLHSVIVRFEEGLRKMLSIFRQNNSTA